MKQILPFILMIGVLLIISNLISNLLNFSLKKRVLDSEVLNEHAVKVVQSLSDSRISSLKWAILLFCGGLGLVVLEFLSYKVENSLLPYGVEAMFLSAGYWIFYLLSKKSTS
jgi:hypothetical protein